MIRAIGLMGIAAGLFLFQGCGGKKAEVASVPPATSSASSSRPSLATGEGPSGQDSGQSSEGSEESSSSGMPGMMSMSPGGDSGMSGRGGSSGPDMGYSEGGSSERYNGMDPNSGFGGSNNPNGFGGSNNPNGFGRGPNRPQRKVPPPTLKEQAVNAFEVGNPKRAFTLMQAYALVVSDEEAADVLKHYRWASQRKRPQLGLNIAVGVSVKNPLNATDLSPIGTQSQNNGGGFGSSGGDFGMSGDPSNPGNEKGLAETTGAFGKQLVAAFKEQHERGAWSPAFSEYSLSTGRSGNFGFGGGSGAFGDGFSNGNGDFGFSEGGGSSGFEGMGPGGMEPGSEGMNSGFGSSGMAPGGMTPGGMTPGGMTPGGMTPGGMTPGGMTPGGMTPGGMTPGGMTPGGMTPGGMTPGGSQTKFQGKGGLRGPGDGMGPGEMNSGGQGMPGQGMPGQGMPGMGRPGMGGPGMGGPGMGGPGMGMPPAFAANAKLHPGASPLAPCLTFIGVDETNKLMKIAAQEGYDGLMIFEVTIGFNRNVGKVVNDTLVRVVQPNAVAKEVKRVYVSKSINNIQYAKSKAKGDPDGLEETVEKIVRETEEGLALQSFPTALTPEVIATKRVPSLAKETETSVINRLSEVNLYYYKGFIDEKQKADAFEQIAGQAGRVIATGSSTERQASIEKLLEREFK